MTSREVDTALDVAAVLDWRLDPTHTRSNSPGPLPWLPGIPPRLRTDPSWGHYLLARHHHVTEAVDAVRAAAETLTPATCPAWARQLLTPEHRQLLTDLAVYRATHAIPDDDTRPTGPRQHAAADRRTQQDLDQRIAHALDTSYRTAWIPLATQLGLTPASDPHWPALVDNLAALARAGADAPALLRAAAAEGPLPDEYQAAAIWWRIARHASPAVLTPDRHSAPNRPATPRLAPRPHHQLRASRHRPTARRPALARRRHRAQSRPAARHPADRPAARPDRPRRAPGPRATPSPTRSSTGRSPSPTRHPRTPTSSPSTPTTTPPEDLHLLTTTLQANTPVNLPDTPLDYRHADTAPVQPLAPAPDSIPADQLALSEAELGEELFHASQARTWLPPWQPSDQQLERTLARAAEAEFSPVSPQRIADLNSQAAAFYQHTYPGSWAQTYLRERLAGTDLTGDPCIQPGYAPPGWTTLTAHLRRHGATDQELLAAGLAKNASTGRLIDTFRDRLILPIHHHDQIIGFIARRNPDTDDADVQHTAKAGPKYLNTSETVLFSKGDQLYGMAEHADRLADGATPVLVEGPLDALAVTLASPDHVGVAPLGTALTDTQADTLIPYLDTRAGGPGVIVATDPDLAGYLAAERDYWMLTARGADPRHATLPPGHDPASLLRTAGPAALHQQLRDAPPLADTLINERLANLQPASALDQALTIVAAGPAHHWNPRTSDIARRLHIPADVALTQLLPHITNWDRDRRTVSDRLARRVPETRDRITGLASQRPTQRWAPLARQIDPALIRAHDWGALAETIHQLDQAGTDMRTRLPQIAAQAPLSSDQPATELRHRLAACLDPPVEPTLTYPAQGTDQTQPYRPHGPRIPAARPTPDSSPPRR